ncbi:SCO family protein [Dermatobacter hominis]|uniref:SCO family protein n=1 Tax=Dermatobacter hominis TaxID=2884263 RepID=UPI001D1302B6|nr:SCO family protein [Dermatobacter hominis]UDY36537.1 SCO family protein [Dermatobacter hominis]
MTLPVDDERASEGAAPQGTVDGPAGGASGRRPRLQITLIALGALAVVVIGLLAATRGPSEEPWAGRILPEPQEKPDLVLTDTSGKPFDLRDRTAGHFTVLFFGYTSCPDVCPINLGTLDTAMETLGPQVRDQVDVVFVSVDPATDTPAVIREYLDRFDTRFIGLTGTPDQLRAAQEAAKVPPAEEGSAESTGSSGTIGHATQMIVYAPDDEARIVYPFGTRQSDWTRDLPRLLGGDVPVETPEG